MLKNFVNDAYEEWPIVLGLCISSVFAWGWVATGVSLLVVIAFQGALFVAFIQSCRVGQHVRWNRRLLDELGESHERFMMVSQRSE